MRLISNGSWIDDGVIAGGGHHAMLSIMVFLEAVITVSRLCRLCRMITAGIRSTKDLKRRHTFLAYDHIVLSDVAGYAAQGAHNVTVLGIPAVSDRCQHGSLANGSCSCLTVFLLMVLRRVAGLRQVYWGIWSPNP